MLLRAMAVLVATGLAVLGIVGGRWWAADERADRTAEALDAARTRTVEILSYDAATLDADIAEARAQVTGELAARFEDVVAQVILPVAGREPGIVSQAEVVRSAVVSAGGHRAVVLLYVDRITTSVLAPEPLRTTHQILVTMTRVPDGRWLVARLEPV
jgi:Mce-associated membrane protein